MKEARRPYATLAILTFTYVINFIDRYTLSGRPKLLVDPAVLVDLRGVLPLIKKYFDLDNSQSGLLNTVFVVSFSLLTPLCGYLGDRYSRRVLMCVGILVWTIVGLAGSFVTKEMYWLFLVCRSLIGIGEASVATVGPSIISDIFTGGKRSLALAIFFISIPVGSGLGYVIGSSIAHLIHDEWQWAFRVSPALGVIACILIALVVDIPDRGAAEAMSLKPTKWTTDMKEIFKIKSMVWTILASGLVSFTGGAMAFWLPTMIYQGLLVNDPTKSSTKISQIFGGLMVVAGIVGVICGSEIARRFRAREPQSATLVSGVAMLLSVPFAFAALLVIRTSEVLTWILIFFGIVFIVFNGALTSDIIMSVVIPTRRSTAQGLNNIAIHVLGDGPSPYIIGLVSDRLATSSGMNPMDPDVQFFSLQRAMFITLFTSVMSGGCFLMAGLTIEDDQRKVDRAGEEARANVTFEENSLNVGEC